MTLFRTVMIKRVPTVGIDGTSWVSTSSVSHVII